ncbi:MAG: SpoIIE family protein phosphatase [Atopobiaceae bacterium]|nr:SpoIIE family protein phosphatase [Atopobiaceae bacterium]
MKKRQRNAQGMKTKNRVRDWKGLLHDKPRSTKLGLFVAFLVVSTSMTFTQYGFIGIGPETAHSGYALGLLAPLAAVTLLLGKGAGSLFGAVSGGVLYLHARFQPLDLFERYFVSSFTSVLFYLFVGFTLGLILAIALHNNPTGETRVVYLGLSSLVASFITTLAFFFNCLLMLALSAFNSYTTTADPSKGYVISSETIGAFTIVEGLDVQLIVDIVIVFVVCVVTDYAVRKHTEAAGDVSVRTTFRTQLFVVAALVFSVVQAVSFVAVTRSAERQTLIKMNDELEYLAGKLQDELNDAQLVVDVLSPYVDAVGDDASEEEGATTGAVPKSVADTLVSSHGVTEVLEGYNLNDGTFVIFCDDKVACSNSPAYPVDANMRELFDAWRTGTLEQLAESQRLQEMLYDVSPHDGPGDSDPGRVELGYMRVRQTGDYYIMMAMPSSMVFASRWSTVTWASITAGALLVTVYVLAERLLDKDVVKPIDRTNGSLARITSGDLEETVHEHKSREFASLSSGINQTVGSLKGLIVDAERRNERDLAVAKRIQESALPRTFPPFPEIGAFDIFAAMDAAKEVGGDFFDFFLVDDATLGFLIADVSGKGIPGALFMMAAKAEIENYMSTGMELAEAIASANRRLCANNDAGMFVTVWAATLCWETGELTYVNAGHNFPLLRHGQGGSWEWLKKKCGLFLGTFETAKYRQEKIMLHPGDELILYTDGVNEAFSPDEQEYGNDRLEAFLAAHADVHPRELVRSLRSDVAAWADGAEQSDDVTILALEYGVAPEVTGTLTVPATLDHLEEAVALVTGELERRLCPVGVLNKVELAIEELFVNICRYAYANKEAPGIVTVSYAYGTNPSAITVELRDEGIPFDPVRRGDPTKSSSSQEAKASGLGILMVERTMDAFTYLRDDDANVIVFKKGW